MAAGVGDPVLQLHLEPSRPIEVSELTAALGSLARQYEDFALANGLAEKAADARLLVSTVVPGSIDISLLSDWASVVVTAPLFASLVERYELIEKFGKHIKKTYDRRGLCLAACARAHHGFRGRSELRNPAVHDHRWGGILLRPRPRVVLRRH
jgi:hypothetical protein